MNKIDLEIGNLIKNYSIAFVALVKDWKDDMPDLRGSGTFIQVDEYKCVLTAAHVIKKLQKYENISFVIENDVQSNIAFGSKYFSMEVIDYEKKETIGPDIGIINFPTELLDHISSKKSFVNLDTNRAKGWYNDHKEGDWCLFGGIGEGTEVDYEKMKVKLELTNYFTGTTPTFYTRDKYDYAVVPLVIDETTPSEFNGLSGGGLWRVVVEEIDGSEVIVENPRLFGVPFQQGFQQGKPVTITCHGPISIYEQVYDYIKRNYA